jgi:hypothetical protein
VRIADAVRGNQSAADPDVAGGDASHRVHERIAQRERRVVADGIRG